MINAQRKIDKSSSHVTQQKEQGFTFIEVLAGIIVSTIFVLVTAQATFIGVVLRVQAQRASEAMNAIQSDFDEIKYLAALSFSQASPVCDAAATTDGYAQALITEIKDSLGQSNNQTGEVSSSVSLVNKSYTMTRTLSVFNQAPYHTMQIGYRVVDPDSGRQIAEYYSEIVPDASFACRN
ncbi:MULTISPECIES: hypothetical protein [Cyanophyceae]|uniref:hypothetical protein n=1 Tax=Cyanophyceae TaxID=3028117 RepID=UPI0008106D74|nr:MULTISPECIES: hypothetical protein [Cyanophyceae]ANV90591.1 hypothetical protein AWQ24_08115 [Picosynechococcus sp. PCC 8807]